MSGPSSFEIVCPKFPPGPFRAALFDFDGTLSLLRRNWQGVMIPMMVDVLAATGTSESREQLREVVEDFVARLTGRQTIYQMIRLAEEVQRRGSKPLDALDYKRRYHDLLWRQVERRIEAVKSRRVPPDAMAVPGSRQLLEALRQKGVALYLASGTDLSYVRDELAVLELEEFFEDRVYGALDDYQKFSKAMIVRRIVEECGVAGEEILGVGDGFVEIEEVCKVGGLALGVASNEDARGGVNVWKRRRLIDAGAHIIIGDYLCREQLLGRLQFAPHS